MATTQYIPHDTANGTSNISGLLFPPQLEAIRKITPQDMEKVFGPGVKDIYEPTEGYTDPEWYFRSSDGLIFGIGWRRGQARLRGRGKRGTSPRRTSLQLKHPTQSQAVEFVNYLTQELGQ